MSLRSTTALSTLLVSVAGACRCAPVQTARSNEPVVEPGPGPRLLDPGTKELLVDVHFRDAKIGFVVGGSLESGAPAVLLRTADGGRSWSRIDTGLETRLYGVHFPTPELGWACGLHGALLRTSDGGKTWKDLGAPLGDVWLADIHFVDAGTGFAVGRAEDGEMLLVRTKDAGEAWQSLRETVPEDVRGSGLRDAHFTTPRVGFACGTEGALLRTGDGGDHWQAVETDTDVWLKCLSFPSPKVGFVGGGEGTLLRTEDGGATWRRLAFPSRDKINGVAFHGLDSGWVATASSGLWETRDGALTWRRAPGVPGELSSARAGPDGTTWITGGGGVVAHVRGLGARGGNPCSGRPPRGGRPRGSP